ncbi:Lsa family ABC-F type ribosomal protection protein [Ruminococcus difficilis]|uniref:Lsa family ABC-F type ribosomal protection protein n=1 Tax=Ruminococcus difficilis TaxID=2763069 RepID=A0A934WR01_9FIRM|nr:Lsa family ABC-F type ribosomal protection protein [Ruminococcus difficilis]MBK6087230.1 Lsa family ABC-F type ribosomal protection protein [Ruminococcus difficilis]
MSMIKVENLTFSYPSSYDNIFENVSFQIDSDWKLGFIGRNGRGKTTFLNLLLGKYKYSGKIFSSVQFDYFPYPVCDKGRMTTDVLAEICPIAEEWEKMRELNYLEVEADVLYRPFSTLSNGEQTKVLLAALFLNEGHFLLIDEPTNHLDMQAREIVSEYLRKKQGFILVSHDRRFVDNCVDHILSINRTNIEVQKGNFSSWWENKQRQDSLEIATNEKLKKEVNRLSEAAKRNANWSDKVEKSKKGTTNSGSKLDKGFVGHKAAKMMKRSKVIEARQQETIEKKSALLKNIETIASLKICPLIYHSDILLRASNLSICYGQNIVCDNVSFEIRQGDRIALDGKNGSGKSSLLKLIVGETIVHSGELSVGTQLIISYVPQDTSHLRGLLSDYARNCEIDESLFKSILRKLGFERVQFEKDIADFSGGQKKKVLIARSLCEQAHLYVWDEPLNFIDVYSRIQIEQLIEENALTMIFVEHDKNFRERIATKTFQL